MVSIIWRVYQRCGKWWRHSAFEFSDTTWSIQLRPCYNSTTGGREQVSLTKGV
jgi:hypothetical protein